jgi:hypothetical protein
VEATDGVLEAVAADEPHGVERPAVDGVAQPVDRDDARVLQPAGDLRLVLEPAAVAGIVGIAVLDLLQRHVAVQLGVAGEEDLAEAAAGVGPQDAEPRPKGAGCAEAGPADGAVGVVVRACGGDVNQAGVELGVSDAGEVPAHRPDGAEGFQARPRIAAAGLEVPGDESLEQGAIVGPHRLALDQDLPHGERLVGDPAVEAVEERRAVDEVVLEG